MARRWYCAPMDLDEREAAEVEDELRIMNLEGEAAWAAYERQRGD